MKKTLIALLLATGLMAGNAMAQDAMSSPDQPAMTTDADSSNSDMDAGSDVDSDSADTDDSSDDSAGE